MHAHDALLRTYDAFVIFNKYLTFRRHFTEGLLYARAYRSFKEIGCSELHSTVNQPVLYCELGEQKTNDFFVDVRSRVSTVRAIRVWNVRMRRGTVWKHS